MIERSPELGRRIREARKAAGLSQPELAALMGGNRRERNGWSMRSVVRLEQGQKDLLDRDLARLERVLRLPPGALLGEPNGDRQVIVPAGNPTTGAVGEELVSALRDLTPEQSLQAEEILGHVLGIVRALRAGGLGDGGDGPGRA